MMNHITKRKLARMLWGVFALLCVLACLLLLISPAVSKEVKVGGGMVSIWMACVFGLMWMETFPYYR